MIRLLKLFYLVGNVWQMWTELQRIDLIDIIILFNCYYVLFLDGITIYWPDTWNKFIWLAISVMFEISWLLSDLIVQINSFDWQCLSTLKGFTTCWSNKQRICLCCNIYHSATTNIKKCKSIYSRSILLNNYKLSLVKPACPQFPDD